MNDNIKKVFEILGVEPNEKFRIEGNGDTIYYIDEELVIYRDNEIFCSAKGLSNLINGYFKIIKLPKEQNKIKKKLRDLTEEEYKKFCITYNDTCANCIFGYVDCDSYTSRCWIHHKDLYSDKFLDQEVEVEE